jgi:predicted MFS family arabinose efflux permease
VASFAQVIVGRLIDTVPIKPLFFGILALQGVVFYLSSGTSGWIWYASAIVYMVTVFAAIPFNDAMVVRYIDDSMRSRVSGTRIAISFGFSSLAVYMLGPVVKQAGFTTLMVAMSLIALIGACCVLGLPGEEQMRASRQEA